MTDGAATGPGEGPDGSPPGPSSGSSPVRGRERKAMLLRLDPAVHEALSRWAADDLRSTNAHVEWLLRRALEQAGRLARDDQAARRDGGAAARG